MSEGNQRKAVDWDAVERDYRAGLLSLREMGEQHGVTHAAIRKKAEKEGWSRDLTAKIRHKTEELVSSDAVSTEVSVDTKSTEREIVEANANLQASIIRDHRKDISRARQVAVALLDELSSQTTNRELYERMDEFLSRGSDSDLGKLTELYQKVISLPGRVNNIKTLSETLKNLVGLERQAFNIDGTRDPEIPGPGASKESITDVARRMAFILASAVNQQEKSHANDK